MATNQPVDFTGKIVIPDFAGKVVSTSWWFSEGEPALEPSPLSEAKPVVELKRRHVYAKPGTHFVTLLGCSQREGDAGETATAIQDLDRMRVVVRC